MVSAELCVEYCVIENTYKNDIEKSKCTIL